MKIFVFRKMIRDKYIDSFICMGLSLCFLGLLTIVQMVYLDFFLIDQPVFDNAYRVCYLMGASGAIGVFLSITQTFRKKPLFLFKFPKENEEVIYLFSYILCVSILGYIIIGLLNKITPDITSFLAVNIYSIHPYLIALFVVFIVLVPISGINVLKNLSENLPRKQKSQKS